MSTLGDQLNILRNTQKVQRRHLEKLYPYLDWSKMPFSSYNDFFRLKNIIDDCGAVWTNAYRRSNDEDAETRKYLKDYSGNGRDIELFNFAFAGMSGYGGYPYNFNNCEKWGAASYNNISSSRLTINAVTNGITFVLPVEYIPNRIFKAKLNVSGYDDNFNVESSVIWTLRISNNANESLWTYINSDGIHEVEYTLPEDATVLYIQGAGSLPTPAELIKPIYIDLLPEYPGALVSDGVDDYGQCIKDFALPDDYTVCAIRNYLTDNNDSGALVYKGSTAGKGAFYFESNVEAGYSYGNVFYNAFPALFSYQSKSSYNGKAITAGTSSDTNDNKLNIFRDGENGKYKKAVLSSFGIFTRTLTEDELRIVENCMMAEYIAMTGILDDVEYYDILDARFRSNEEDAEKRNKWTGRFGKLHMTLHNYAYSGNSGWNGETGEDGKPLYGGALVSDGVDDYAVSDEIIDEPIGGVAFLAHPIQKGSAGYIFGAQWKKNSIFSYLSIADVIVIGDTGTNESSATTKDLNRSADNFYSMVRTPAIPDEEFAIAVLNKNAPSEFGKNAIYQLRLIKSQPTDIQLEAIKWQMQKEHEDYLIQNGWMEIEPDEQ